VNLPKKARLPVGAPVPVSHPRSLLWHLSLLLIPLDSFPHNSLTLAFMLLELSTVSVYEPFGHVSYFISVKQKKIDFNYSIFWIKSAVTSIKWKNIKSNHTTNKSEIRSVFLLPLPNPSTLH
jgi:hypothetical protein